MEYFTKAHNIDPENIYILIKRAITYYVIQEYDKTLSDLNKVIRKDLSNSIAYYYEGLTNYTMKNISDVDAFPNDNLAKIQFYYLKDLLDNNDFKDDIITKSNQNSKINDDKSLLFIRCIIYIKLQKYYEAELDLFRLFELHNEDVSFIYLLREYSDFWSYLCNCYRINNNTFAELGIVDGFSSYMYKKGIYFVSNLVNLDNKFCQFLEDNSFSGQVLSFTYETLPISLPKHRFYKYSQYITWKINIKEILSKDCFVKFIITEGYLDKNFSQEHILNYEDVLKLKGLGWIEYTLPFLTYTEWIQPSIELKNHSIILQIDYIRLKSLKGDTVYHPKVENFLLMHKLHPKVPEIFDDTYFLRKKMENLIELDDIF